MFPKCPTLIYSDWLNNILLFGIVLATLYFPVQGGVGVTALPQSFLPSLSLASLCWCATSVLSSKISAPTLVIIVDEPQSRAAIIPLPPLGIFNRLRVDLRVSTNMVVILYWCWGKWRHNWRSKFSDEYGGRCLRCLSCRWIGKRWVLRACYWCCLTWR